MQNFSPSKNWRMQKVKYRLRGGYCSKCKSLFFPVKIYCPICHSGKNIKDKDLPTKGKILSWSLIHAAPVGFEEIAPYPVALVKLDGGPIVFTQITDYTVKDIKIGTRVEAVFRRLATPGEATIIKYGIKFRPAGW